jgi:membrane-bound lytic murein transglycosylase D
MTRHGAFLRWALAAALACLSAHAWSADATAAGSQAPTVAEAAGADAVAAVLLMRGPADAVDAALPAQPATLSSTSLPTAPSAPSSPASPALDPGALDAAAVLGQAPGTTSLQPAAPLQAAPASAPEPSPGTPAQGNPNDAGAPAVATPADASPAVPAAATTELTPAQARDLWERIRKGFAMPDLTGKRAASSTHWYAGQPDYMARMAARASLYLYFIVQEIEKRHLPTELALLPFVESAMQPQAVSSAQAAGLWQFIPSTGRLYSLEQNLWKDERLGVVESTRAALDYLEKLYGQFGSWHLALAAYNYGESGVERAIAYNRKRNKPLDYESLRLPRETQNYVPKLQAIKNIIADPQHYGIDLPQIRDEPYFVTVSGSRDIDVATAAQLADMPVDDFRALNPAFSRPLIVGAMAPTILLPADRGEKFSANLAAWEATGQPLASWTAYRLKSGESLAQVAQRVGVTEASLRTANHVPPRYVLRAGSTILVPRDEASAEDVSAEMLGGSMALVPEKSGLRKITVRVRRGDTLASIARRWHVGTDEIVAWNDLHSNGLFAGQRLSLTVAGGGTAHKGPAHTAHAAPAVHATPVAAGPTTLARAQSAAR